MKIKNRNSMIAIPTLILLITAVIFTGVAILLRDDDTSHETKLIERLLHMIKKSDTEGETTISKVEEMREITYTTVTNGYDWGPAVDKIVLNIGTVVDLDTFVPEIFRVNVKNMETEHVVARKVIRAYTSDASGVATDDSSYIALEFEVGPTMSESSPFNYDFIKGRNVYIKTAYEISVDPESELATANGNKLTFMPTDYEDFTDDIQTYCDQFVHNQDFERDDVALKFASFTPVKQTENKIPLIIWLHGAGEGGVDTTIAVLGNNVTNLIKEATQSYFGDNGAYVLVPQAPTMWMDLDGNNIYNITVKNSDGHSYYADALMGLIEQFVMAHPDIDTDRIYIGGCSNGGYMTVKMIIDHPDYFAAAYPAAEAYSAEWLTQERVDALKDFPIWLTHAQNDPTVRISEGETADGKFIPLDDFSNALYNRLIAAGNENAHYSLYDNVVDTSGEYLGADGKPYEYNGHWSWIYTLNNECSETIDGKTTTLFEWLAEQRR